MASTRNKPCITHTARRGTTLRSRQWRSCCAAAKYLAWRWSSAAATDCCVCLIHSSQLVGGIPAPLKNISQLGLLFPIYGKIKNVPNHQSARFFRTRKLMYEWNVDHISMIRCSAKQKESSWGPLFRERIAPGITWYNYIVVLFE